MIIENQQFESSKLQIHSFSSGPTLPYFSSMQPYSNGTIGIPGTDSCFPFQDTKKTQKIPNFLFFYFSSIFSETKHAAARIKKAERKTEPL